MDIKERRKKDREYYKLNRKRRIEDMNRWRIANREWFMWRSAKIRAEKKGIPFDITIEDIEIPEKCPILGIDLKRDAKMIARSDSPSLDRIIPELGYVRGNIQVISFKANTMKNSASKEELKLFANWILNCT